jgi:uncharacterized protein
VGAPIPSASAGRRSLPRAPRGAVRYHVEVRIALVSDTHGLSDPRLLGLFRGCARVLHAGDVVTTPVLAALGRVAEVTAVRGNNDHGPDLAPLPQHALVLFGELRALLVHDLGAREGPHPAVRRLLARERPEIVVHGHSHRPGAAVHEGRLFVNPGSAGPRRFSLPRTAAILEVEGRTARVAFFELTGERPRPFGELFEAAL